MAAVRLAIDVDSGDYGATVLIEGVLIAAKACKVPLHLFLCGNEKKIQGLLKNQCSDNHATFHYINCTESIHGEDLRARVWKNKENASLVKCISLQKEGVVDASMSAGDTGALLSASVFLLERQKGVKRPALAAFLPTTQKGSVLLLDVGANLNCKAEHLCTFGMMGYDYYKKCYCIENPRVRLLNIGHESWKGTKEIMETDQMLRQSCPGYSGYIEGGRVLSGDADVIVCDGFVGNVLLKACESFYTLTESVLGHDSQLLESLEKKMTILNSENYGSVPLLGVNGIVMKAHGSSSAQAIANAILMTIDLAMHHRNPHETIAASKGCCRTYAS